MKIIYSTYIMASRRNGTLYIGVTRDLAGRVYEHKNELVEGFTKTYNVKTLVYYQVHGSPFEAIYAEKKMKRLSRKEKVRLIEANNPYWRDLYQGLL